MRPYEEKKSNSNLINAQYKKFKIERENEKLREDIKL